MQFVKIQSAKTLEIIQWRVDQKRVTKEKYDQSLPFRPGSVCGGHFTNRTRNGNFRHGFYAYNSMMDDAEYLNMIKK